MNEGLRMSLEEKERRMSLEEHDTLGRELYNMQRQLTRICVRLARIYGDHAKECILADGTGKSLFALRTHLEGRLFEEHKDDACVTMYFPGKKD